MYFLGEIMSLQYTAIFCSKKINEIKDGICNSYENLHSELRKHFCNQFWVKGLADMCWNKMCINFDYAKLRADFYKYDCRFKNFQEWNTFSETQKEELSKLADFFETESNQLCGFEMKFNSKFMKSLFPYGYFFPTVKDGINCIKMESLTGDSLIFTLEKNIPSFNERIKNWKTGQIYSLNKLIAALKDNRIKVQFNGERL